MKVFLSWSGGTSHKIALIFRDWFPSVIQSIEPYVSSEDIDKGERWSTDIASELEDSIYGILCVTKKNVHAPWLTFEAGALSRTMNKSYVSPFLFNIKRAEVNGPILQFQSTVFEKEDIKKLLGSLNKACNDDQLTQERLDGSFDVWYPILEEKLNDLLASCEEARDEEPSPEKSDTADKILEEILDLTRDNQKLLRSSEDEPSKELASVKIMLKKFIKTIEHSASPSLFKHRREMHPMMIHEIISMSSQFDQKLIGFQIALSQFRNDFPWVYGAGMDLAKTIESQVGSSEKKNAVEDFFKLLEFTFKHPMIREMYSADKNVITAGLELKIILEYFLELELERSLEPLM